MPVVLNGERIEPLKTYQEINATEELGEHDSGNKFRGSES